MWSSFWQSLWIYGHLTNRSEEKTSKSKKSLSIKAPTSLWRAPPGKGTIDGRIHCCQFSAKFLWVLSSKSSQSHFCHHTYKHLLFSHLNRLLPLHWLSVSGMSGKLSDLEKLKPSHNHVRCFYVRVNTLVYLYIFSIPHSLQLTLYLLRALREDEAR